MNLYLKIFLIVVSVSLFALYYGSTITAHADEVAEIKCGDYSKKDWDSGFPIAKNLCLFTTVSIYWCSSNGTKYTHVKPRGFFGTCRPEEENVPENTTCVQSNDKCIQFVKDLAPTPTPTAKPSCESEYGLGWACGKFSSCGSGRDTEPGFIKGLCDFGKNCCGPTPTPTPTTAALPFCPSGATNYILETTCNKLINGERWERTDNYRGDGNDKICCHRIGSSGEPIQVPINSKTTFSGTVQISQSEVFISSFGPTSSPDEIIVTIEASNTSGQIEYLYRGMDRYYTKDRTTYGIVLDDLIRVPNIKIEKLSWTGTALLDGKRIGGSSGKIYNDFTFRTGNTLDITIPISDIIIIDPAPDGNTCETEGNSGAAPNRNYECQSGCTNDRSIYTGQNNSCATGICCALNTIPTPIPTEPTAPGVGYCADGLRGNANSVDGATCDIFNETTWLAGSADQYCRNKYNIDKYYFFECNTPDDETIPLPPGETATSTPAPVETCTGPSSGPCAGCRNGVTGYLQPRCGTGEEGNYSTSKANAGLFCTASYYDVYLCGDGKEDEVPSPRSNSTCASVPWCFDPSGSPIPPVGANTPIPTPVYSLQCPNAGHLCAVSSDCNIKQGEAGVPGFSPKQFTGTPNGNDACREHYAGSPTESDRVICCTNL